MLSKREKNFTTRMQKEIILMTYAKKKSDTKYRGMHKERVRETSRGERSYEKRKRYLLSRCCRSEKLRFADASHGWHALRRDGKKGCCV